MSTSAKVWIALWVVYIVWGSTYLGIELVGETMPATFAAGVRFTAAGLLMLGFIAWRREPARLRLTRRELASSAVVGLLLPGANSILFITEQKVPIGLTSLIIAAIPLWVVLLRLLARERPDLVSTIVLVVGFGGIVLLVQPGSDTGRVPLTHDGEEGGIVVSGRLEVTVDDERRILDPGDAYYFESRRPHRFRCVGAKPCEVISACTPPTF